MSERCTFLGPLFTDGVPDAVVAETVAALREAGVATTPDGDEDRIARYEVRTAEGTDYREDGSVADVAGALADADEVQITAWLDGHRFVVTVDPDATGPTEPAVSLRRPEQDAFDPEQVSPETALARADTLVDAFAGLAERFDPWYAYGEVRARYTVDPFPEGRPPESGVERLPWLAVFDASWFDRFGGRERVLDAPAWDVRSLDTGSVLLRDRDLPPLLDEAEGGTAVSTYAYLFDELSVEELRGGVDDEATSSGGD